MTCPRVLVVEDEPAIRDALCAAMEDAGWTAFGLEDCPDLPGTLRDVRPDLAVLDVMLPTRDGLSLARELRRTEDIPVLFVTARDAVADRLRGFEAGGEDYVVKPFVLEEVVARVRALLRRAGRLTSHTIEVGDLLVDEGSNAVSRAGQPLALTPTELRLLGYLARHRGRVVSKLQLLTQVWGYEGYDPNTVEVAVAALRRKLDVGGRPGLIHTERGLGYVLRAA